MQPNTRRRVAWGAMCLAALLACLFLARPVAAEDSSHTMLPGETLRLIAQRYGATVEELAAANQIVNPNVIYVGQVLVIPGNIVEEEDERRAPTETEGAPEAEDPVVHIVRPGETLTRIAANYGTSTADILRLNQLTNPNLIFAGQRLMVGGSLELARGAHALHGEPVPPPTKRIVVDKSEQRAYVYENGELLWTFVVSTGMPGSETWEGSFAVRSKITNAYAQLWGLQMPYWLGFYHTGYLENGFHALPIMPSGAILWDGYLGTPVSYGCVILSYADAAMLFQWAEIGTEVVVQP